MNRLFCFGFGYVARRLAQHLKGWHISGTSRTTHAPYQYDGTQPISPSILDLYSSFLISVPPDDNIDNVLKNHEHYFKQRKQPVHWIGYLSATSVYGNHNGAWVFETSETTPTSARGNQRLACEQQWLELACSHNLPFHIFRLSGIYGPQRNPLATIMAQPTPIIHKPNHLFSRIHVDDICQTLIKSMQHPASLSVYNLADDEPASSADVLEYAYGLLGLTPPARTNYEDAELSAMALEFYSDYKRVSNQKIKHDLKVSLLYPTYKDGLTQCFTEMQELKG